MFLDKYQNVHCIGIGGIGISGIAKFLHSKGKTVSGSDAYRSNVTDGVVAAGISVFIGHDARVINSDIDLIVYSEAVPEENEERMKAKELGIPQLGHFDFLGELSKEYRTICITGTNGKSTTTAMTGKIFEDAEKDPTVFVGTLVPGWELGNVRVGESDILIIEGDEYKQKMVKLFPETTVITNIEEDHLDVYRDLDHIVQTFQELADKTKGLVITNSDDPNSKKITAKNLKTFGHILAEDIELKVPGAFNRMNALAATMAAREYEIDDLTIASSLAEFSGVWRRFERVGDFNGAIIISDYGHHPTAIAGTLVAAREFFPGQRIVLCFQPHQHSRTKALFDDFVESFKGADLVILPEIYHVEGRNEEEGKISSRDLLNALGDSTALYAHDLEETEKLLRKEVKPGDVVLIMGAGNIDDVARKLVK
jgi:UDP-N-acetylmuramate--alanine ligase